MARKAASGIYLPWERRGGFVRRLGLARARPFAVGLVVLGVVVLFGVRERQRTGERATRAALLVVRRAVDSYRADHDGKCPRQLEEVERAGYLTDLPDDAWGRPLRLACPSRREGVAYDLSSDGPDGEPGGLDRIE
ncbi:MAG TPA: type II secretion system protein GspG [Polyangiaceae bacterium]|nr:type II secretion system protein GspG [Polyangiaceae bacterium]